MLLQCKGKKEKSLLNPNTPNIHEPRTIITHEKIYDNSSFSCTIYGDIHDHLNRQLNT